MGGSDLVKDLIIKVSANNGFKRREISKEEIFERLFYPLINEGFKVLQEGVAKSPADVDVVYIHGYGYPRSSGGPMFMADQIGLEKLAGALQKYEKMFPKKPYFAPAQLLQDCVAAKKSLTAFWAKNGKNYKHSRELNQ